MYFKLYHDDDHTSRLGRTVDEADGDTASHLIVWKLPYCCDSEQSSCPLKMLANETNYSPTTTPSDPTTATIMNGVSDIPEFMPGATTEQFKGNLNEKVATETEFKNSQQPEVTSLDTTPDHGSSNNMKSQDAAISPEETAAICDQTSTNEAQNESLYLDTVNSNCEKFDSQDCKNCQEETNAS